MRYENIDRGLSLGLFTLEFGGISVANSKVYAKLGNDTTRDLTQDTIYQHPAEKQCTWSPDLSNYVTKDELSGVSSYEAGYKTCTTSATISLSNAFDFIIICGRTYRPANTTWFIYSNIVTLSKCDIGHSTINYSSPSGVGKIINNITSISSKSISLTLQQAEGNTNYVCWISFYS